MNNFKVGDRVTMVTGLETIDGRPPPRLFGVVEFWPKTGGLIVRWNDWPAMTALPNPNVEKVR